jgi:TRAP-type C4-dicarboxylate transport system permease small subunit
MVVERKFRTGFHRRLSLIVMRIDQVEMIFTAVCMVAIILINGAEIFSRYVLDVSLFFVYEITLLLANWMYFIGFCLVFNRSKDIEIEFFMNLLSYRKQWYFLLLTKIIVFSFLMLLGYYAFQLMLIQSRHSTEGLNIPNHLFSMPIFIGTISMLLSLTRDTIGMAVGSDVNQGDK